MKSIKNIKRIMDGVIYISIDTQTAIELQNKNIRLIQFKGLKSIFVKELDYKFSILEDNLINDFNDYLKEENKEISTNWLINEIYINNFLDTIFYNFYNVSDLEEKKNELFGILDNYCNSIPAF